mgnify:CR=1 FL=1
MSNTMIYTGMPSDLFSLERVRYFPRMLITPDDMIAEQNYFRNKLRRHNRLLHGWGVVCGCKVLPGDNPYEVKITPGYILGPYGDEIVVWKELTFDVRTELVCACSEDTTSNSTQLDPWCSEVKRSLQSGQRLYIAIKYKEMESRFVRAHPRGCSCDQARCEASRFLDCFVIKALTELPASHDADPQFGTRFDPDIYRALVLRREAPFVCPACPGEPWVVLADIAIGNNGCIPQCDIDNCMNRRWIYTPAEMWWQCKEAPSLNEINPAQGHIGATINGASIDGCHFYTVQGSGALPVNSIAADFLVLKDGVYVVDNLLNVSDLELLSSKKLTFTLKINADAVQGSRHVRITNPDGQTAVLENGFMVLTQVGRFRIIDAISSTDLEPNKVTVITLKGENFTDGLNVDVHGKASLEEVESIDKNEIRVRLKPWKNFKGGTLEFLVEDKAGKRATLKADFGTKPQK